MVNPTTCFVVCHLSLSASMFHWNKLKPTNKGMIPPCIASNRTKSCSAKQVSFRPCACSGLIVSRESNTFPLLLVVVYEVVVVSLASDFPIEVCGRVIVRHCRCSQYHQSRNQNRYHHQWNYIQRPDLIYAQTPLLRDRDNQLSPRIFLCMLLLHFSSKHSIGMMILG